MVAWLNASVRVPAPSITPAYPHGDEGRQPQLDHAKRHILTIAVEDYYHTGPFRNLISHGNWYRFESRLEIGTLRALDLLDQFGTKATFFALGWVADAAPELIRKIVARGHEVATRGYYHRALREFEPAEFREDTIRAREAVERASGRGVIGYRVAEGCLAPDDLWALRVLAELGFAYDSSLKPMLREWPGEPHRRFIHRQMLGDRALWEIPFSSTRVAGLDVPISGGNYFRQWPHWLVQRAVSRWDRECPAPFVMYFHTWELDPAQPKFHGAALHKRIRQYRNLGRMPMILGHYLSTYRFTGIADHLGLPVAPRRAATLVRDAAPPSRQLHAFREAVTIVVPCYNEAAALPYLANTLQSVRSALVGRYDISVILVDDASTDRTWDVLQELFGKDLTVRCFRQPVNRGAAAAILRGIRHAETPIVCSIDADCSYDPHELADMLPLLTEGVDVVTASPYHPDGGVLNVPRWRLVLSKIASRLYRLVFRHQLHTYTSCFRVYRRSVVAKVEVRRGGFVGLAEMLAQLEQGGARIVEFPTTLKSRLLGHSKLRVVRTAIGHLLLMTRLARGRFRHRSARSVLTTPAGRVAT